MLVLYIYNSNIVEIFSKCDYDNLALNRDQLLDLKDLLERFIQFTKEQNIEYFAIAGTLIGCIRNGGLLPQDDDIDFGIFKDKCSIIDDYKNDIYYFEKQSFGYKFKKKDSDMFIDIMVFENKNDYYCIIENNWPNETFNDINEILPLVEMSYSDFNINVPNKYIQYLDRAFPNWNTEIKVDCGHHSKECIYDKHKIPTQFNIDYENSKYLCYSSFTP